MKNKKAILRAVRTILCALTALTGPVLYFFLVNKGVGDSMMYSAKSPVFVIALSILGAVGVYIILNLPLSKEVPEETDFEEYEEEETHSEAWTPEQSTDEARALYPELFRDSPEPEAEEEAKPRISSAYYDAMTSAINSQKAEVVIENGEREEEADDILKIEKTESDSVDILADLPETLPEGYTPYLEDEETEEDEEEEAEEIKKKSLVFRIAKRIAVIVLILVLSVSFCIISALSYTIYESGGLTVHTVFSEENYTWQDCEKFEIAPSFFGDRIDVTLYMKNGEKISLLPSDAVFKEAFYKKYDSMYEYALHAANEMEDTGAEKHVKERNTIESNFYSREDIGEYIKNLIK